MLRRRQLLLRVSRHAGKVLRGDRRPVVLLPHGRLFLRRGAVLPARRVNLPLSRCGHLERRRRPTVAVVRPVLVAHPGGSARRMLHGVLPKAADAAAHAGRAAVLRTRRAAARHRLRLPDHGAAVLSKPDRRRIRSFESRRCRCVPAAGSAAARACTRPPSALGAAARADDALSDDVKTDRHEVPPF